MAEHTKTSPAWRRIAAAFTIALAIAFSAYCLISLSRSNSGVSSLWFLAVLPAFLSALICYIGDPKRSRGTGFYWATPAVLVLIVCAASAFILKEGVVCLILLAPIWLISGWIGAFTLKLIRKRKPDPTLFNSSLLLLPLLAGVVEAQIAFPYQSFTVTRSIIIEADCDDVWTYAVANANIHPTEGRWTFSQSVLGLPRPRASTIDREGVGAIRKAYWGDHIHFDEVITGWQPGGKLKWDFAFTNTSLQDYTDKHISPDGPMLKIASGDYTLERIAPNRTRLTLQTRYIAKTHANLYAALWG
ncbi:MAG TPA: SRPBCC family protein, partial [Asticcacaulis sp.]|nr:SRPBCC family protein [Asticcacaulis sp.]